jgi:16S rRNA (uracil1498-N3)-methyltransferase
MSERFYSQRPLEVATQIELDATQSHHLLHVLRATVGQEIRLFDGSPQEFLGRISAKDRRAVRVEVIRARGIPQPPPPPLIVAAPVPKGDRRRYLIEKLTELGVDAYLPLRSQRSVNPYTASLEKKSQQWVIEACKQSGRNTLLRLLPPCHLDTLLARTTHVPTRWLAAVPPPADDDPRGRGPSGQDPGGQDPDGLDPDGRELDPSGRELDDVDPDPDVDTALGLISAAPDSEPRAHEDNASVTQALWVLGPEGGFTPAEIRQMTDGGFKTRVIGPHVLRVETAAVACAAWWIAQHATQPAAAESAPHPAR